MRVAALLLAMCCVLPIAAMAADAPVQSGVSDALFYVHIDWRIGDRGTIVTLDYDMLDDQRSTLKANFNTTGDILIVDGQVGLSEAEVRQIRAAVRTADFWQLPDDRALDAGVQCWNGFEIRAEDYNRRKWISRDCPDRRKDAAAISLARTLVVVAQKHFSDLTARPEWRDVLR